MMDEFFKAVDEWLENSDNRTGKKFQRLPSRKGSNWPAALTSLLSIPEEVDDICVDEVVTGDLYGYRICATQATEEDGSYYRWVHVYNFPGERSDLDWQLVEPDEVTV